MPTILPRPEGETLLEGAAALQLYLSRILINVTALKEQGALLVQAVADQRRLARDLQIPKRSHGP